MNTTQLKNEPRKLKQTIQNKIAKRWKLICKRPLLYLLIAWFSFAWSWVFFTDMLDLAGTRRQGYVLALFIFLANVLITTSVLWNAYRLLMYIQHKYKTRGLLLLGLPLLALADFLACWLTTIIWLGPQGRADNILPMGSMALPAVSTPFRFASRFVGFYGLAAFFWLGIYLVSFKKTRKLAIYPMILLSMLSLAGWYLWRAPQGVPVKTVLISETLTDRVASIDSKNVDLVVFPEYGLDKITNKNLSERIKRTQDVRTKTYFVGSEQVYSEKYTGHINNMLFGNTTQGITDKQYKYRLIPGGEDLPYIVRTLLRATGQRPTLDYFSYAKGVIKGRYQLKPFVASDQLHIAAAVCSSIIAPQDYRQFARSGATLFTNSASLSIFQGSNVFAWQQKSLARFMATSNIRYFLQSANGASAYALDTNGKQVAEAKGKHVLHVTAQTSTATTPYTYLGEWLAWLGVASLLVLGIIRYRTSVKHKS